MSFPDDPLDLVVEIAPGANPADDPMTYEWVDITDRWKISSPITISRGKSSPLADTVPSSCSLTLDNSDGRFTPRNPIGPYYPDLQRNTPLRVRLRQAYDQFGRTVSNGWGTADSGQLWAVAGAATSQFLVDGSRAVVGVNATGSLFTSTITGVGGECDVTVYFRPEAEAVGAQFEQRVRVRYNGAEWYETNVQYQTSGQIDVYLVRGFTSLAGNSAHMSYNGGTTVGVRLQALGSTIRHKVWDASGPQPAAWTATVTDTAVSGAGTDGVQLAAQRLSGNTQSGLAVKFDNLTIHNIRFTGYVDAWPPRWDPSGTLKWVPITAHGTLLRISSAGEATRSALYRYISEQQTLGLVGYWPMEDGPLATEPASEVQGVGPMSPSAPVRFGQASPSAGVGTLVDTSGAYLHTRITARYATDWRVECVVAHDSVPTTTVRVLSWLCPGSIGRWDLNTTATGFRLVGLSAVSGGSTLINISTGVIPQPGQLHHLRVDVTLSGTTNIAEVYVDGVLAGSGTNASSLTLQPTVLRVNPDASTVDMPAVGHVAIWAASPLPATDSAAAALGSPGEEAHARVAAVCAERSVPYAAYGTVTSEPMGPRPSGSLVALLREAEATDGGILYELTSGHLSYRPRSTLYNQPAALELDYAARHIAPPLEPSDDDAQLRNDVTARRPSGSEARYVDDAHIAKAGRYETSLPVNPSDDGQLEQVAAWAVHRGTVEEQRFDTIALRMTAGDPVVSGWLGCDIGSRITVANVPSDLTPDDVDVILVGYTETYGEHPVWSVQALCEPASSWTIGELDDPVLGRLGTAGSELAVGTSSAQIRGDSSDRAVVADGGDVALFSVGCRVVLHDSNGRRKEPTVFTVTSIGGPAFGVRDLFLDPLPAELILGNFTGDFDSVRRVDQTSLSVATTSDPLWTTNPAHVPFDVNVSGEQVTVTAISGAASPQTFTVTRAVNGVEKAHPAGTSVQLWQPLILGL